MNWTSLSRFTLVATAVLLAACNGGSQELSRGKAKDLISKAAENSTQPGITLSNEAAVHFFQVVSKTPQVMEAFVADKRSSGQCLPDPTDVRLLSGQFILCRGYIPPGVTWQNPGLFFKLKKPAAWNVVEVTGITDPPQSSHELLLRRTLPLARLQGVLAGNCTMNQLRSQNFLWIDTSCLNSMIKT